ncbi:hypothetical protein AAE478_006737 [Parahypoxylon ruwenzoriense]
MDHAVIHKVLVDSANASVAHYGFAADAYFLLPSRISNIPMDNTWDWVCSETIKGIWLFALPATVGKPNAWKIAFELETDAIVTLELYDTRTTRGLVLLVRSIRGDASIGGSDHFLALTKTKAVLYGRRMKNVMTLRDIVAKLQSWGLLKYRLKDGRGHRHWVYAVLCKLQPFIHEPRKWGNLSDEADSAMRNCWLTGGRCAATFGYANEDENPLNIKLGLWPQGLVKHV